MPYFFLYSFEKEGILVGTINARQIQKNDISANWAKATNFIPKLGELILYTDLNKIKIGDGVKTVNSLPFLSTPDKVSELTNDSNFISEDDIQNLLNYSYTYNPLTNKFYKNDKEVSFDLNTIIPLWQKGVNYYLLVADNNSNEKYYKYQLIYVYNAVVDSIIKSYALFSNNNILSINDDNTFNINSSYLIIDETGVSSFVASPTFSTIEKQNITDNTAARHTHNNKPILDQITGIVSKDNINNPAHTTDLIDYNGLQASNQQIINQIPTTTGELTNNSGFVTETYVNEKVANIVNSAPEALDTLSELAAALGNDENFSTTVATNIGTKVSKSGDTMTGPLIVPQVQTGTDAANYFQCQKFRGQGNANEYYHAIDFGYSDHNQVDFHEYGAIWNFYKNTTGTADGGTLVASIKEDGFHGNMADYTTETWTFTLANGSTVTKNVVIK